MTQTTVGRRALLRFIPGAAALTATTAAASAIRAAEAPQVSTKEQVQNLIDSLSTVLLAEFPADTTRLLINASAAPEKGEVYISATGLRLEWRENQRLQNGGLWVEELTGRWCQLRGYEAPR